MRGGPVGEAGCEFILGLTVPAGLATKTIAKTSLVVVNVDTTMQDKGVAFPTDARLSHKARVALVRQTAFVRLQHYHPPDASGYLNIEFLRDD